MKKIITDDYEFEHIIEGKAVYVDKTDMLARMASGRDGTQFFMSRPRRFGKSLMLTTLKAMFEGRHDLFKGLKIEKTKWDWTKTYPVIMLNMSEQSADTPAALETNLYGEVQSLAERFGVDVDWKKCATSGKAFRMFLSALYEKSGPFVVLVDEYDVPLQGFLDDKRSIRRVRKIMHDFYVQLKNNVKAIRFLMITGVTKLTKLSLFSGLNNPTDLSLESKTYAGLLGYTKDDIETYFGDRIASIARKKKKTPETVLNGLLDWYDSYRFCPDSSTRVCNPISVGKALNNELLVSYWIKTASASLLVERMRALNAKFSDLENVLATRDELDVCDAIEMPLVPLAYQSGYLTIKGKSKTELDEYGQPKLILGIPNHEVRGALKGAFWNSLMQISEQNFTALVHEAERQIAAGDIEGLLEILYGLYAKLPPTWSPKKEADAKRYFLLFMEMAGAKLQPEKPSYRGFADAVIETKKSVWIFEFKFNRSAASAIRQIRERGYADAYKVKVRGEGEGEGEGRNYPSASNQTIPNQTIKQSQIKQSNNRQIKQSNNRQITLIGIKFDSNRRNIDIPKIEAL